MNMASIAMHCTMAATAGVIAVGLGGCTGGEAVDEADASASVVDPRPEVNPYTRTRVDGRGRLFIPVRPPIPAEVPGSTDPIPDDADPHLRHFLAWWEIAEYQHRLRQLGY
jgi:hypothetical protein